VSDESEPVAPVAPIEPEPLGDAERRAPKKSRIANSQNPLLPAGKHKSVQEEFPDIHIARSRRRKSLHYSNKIIAHSALAKSLRLRIPKVPYPLRAPSLFVYLPEFGIIASDGPDKGKILSTTEFNNPTHTAKPDKPLKLLASIFARLLEQVEYSSSSAANKDIAEFIEFVMTIAPQSLIDETPAWKTRTRAENEEAARQRVEERKKEKRRRKWRRDKKREKARRNRERREKREAELRAKAEAEREAGQAANADTEMETQMPQPTTTTPTTPPTTTQGSDSDNTNQQQ
jgi:hypothetical protein